MEAVAFSSNMATLVVSAGLDGRLVVWDTATFDSRNTCTHPQVGCSPCNAAVICTPTRTPGAVHLRLMGCSWYCAILSCCTMAGPTLTVPAQHCGIVHERDIDRNTMCRESWQWHAIHLHHLSSQAALMACYGSGTCARVRHVAVDVHALLPSLALMHLRLTVVIRFFFSPVLSICRTMHSLPHRTQ